MRENYALVFQLYAEKPARELLQHRTGYFYAVLFAHKPPNVRWAGRRSVPPVRTPPARGCQLSRCDVGSLQTLGALGARSAWGPGRPFNPPRGPFTKGAIPPFWAPGKVNKAVFPVPPGKK